MKRQETEKQTYNRSKQEIQLRNNTKYQLWSFGMSQDFLQKGRKGVQGYIDKANMIIKAKFDIYDLFVTHMTDRLYPSPINHNLYYTNVLEKDKPAQKQWPYVKDDKQRFNQIIMQKDVFQIKFTFAQSQMLNQYKSSEPIILQIIFDDLKSYGKNINLELTQYSGDGQKLQIIGKIQVIGQGEQGKFETIPLRFISYNIKEEQEQLKGIKSSLSNIKDHRQINKNIIFPPNQKVHKTFARRQNSQRGRNYPQFKIISENEANIKLSQTNILKLKKFHCFQNEDIVENRQNKSKFTIFSFFIPNEQIQEQEQDQIFMKKVFGEYLKYNGPRSVYIHISSRNHHPIPKRLYQLDNYINLGSIDKSVQSASDFKLQPQQNSRQQQVNYELQHAATVQGDLGNCYMIAVMNVLCTEAPQYIRNAIILQCQLPNIFIVVLNIDGKRTSIMLPTILPWEKLQQKGPSFLLKQRIYMYASVNHNFLQFARKQQIIEIARYSVYIETALAKVYRYYSHLTAGQCSQIFMLLTNTNSTKYSLKTLSEKQKLKQILKAVNNNRYKQSEQKILITMYLGRVLKQNKNNDCEPQDGLKEAVQQLKKYYSVKHFQKHAYSFHGSRLIKDPISSQKKLIIKLNNPNKDSGKIYMENWQKHNSNLYQEWRKQNQQELKAKYQNVHPTDQIEKMARLTSNQFLIDFELLHKLGFQACVCRANKNDKYRQKQIIMVESKYTQITITPRQQGKYSLSFIRPNIRHTFIKIIEQDVTDIQRDTKVKEIMENNRHSLVNMLLVQEDNDKLIYQTYNDQSSYPTLSCHLQNRTYTLKIGQYFNEGDRETQPYSIIYREQLEVNGKIDTSQKINVRKCYLSILGKNAQNVVINNHIPNREEVNILDQITCDKNECKMFQISEQTNPNCIITKMSSDCCYLMIRIKFQGQLSPQDYKLRKSQISVTVRQTINYEAYEQNYQKNVQQHKLIDNYSKDSFFYILEGSFKNQKTFMINIDINKTELKIQNSILIVYFTSELQMMNFYGPLRSEKKVDKQITDI